MNNMQKLRFLLFIGLCCIWFSCSKEEEEIPTTFPVQFAAERWELNGKYRLFTNGREILDARIIQQFAQNHPFLDSISDHLDSIPSQHWIRFLSEHNAVFDNNYDQSEQVFELQRKGNRFLFHSVRPLYLPQPKIKPFYAPSAEWLLMKEIDTLKNSVPGAPFPYQTQLVRVAHGNFKVLKVSMLGFVLTLPAEGSNTSPTKHQNVLFNEYNPEFPKHLGSKDTLLIQEFAVIFTRKD